MSLAPMEKLKCGPVVEVRCDDMARVVLDLVRGRLIEPYVDADLRVFDLSIEHCDQTNDTVTLEAVQALTIHNVGVKCATITAEKDVLENYHLKHMLTSPNAAIRNALGGAVFREPMVCRNIPPLAKQWRKPIVIARHAFGDQYNSQEFLAPAPGTIQIKHSPTIRAPYNFNAPLPARVRDVSEWLGAQPPKKECLELQATPRIYQDFSTKPAPAGTSQFLLKRIRDDYDTVVRQNVSRQAECEMSKLQEDCNNLKEYLSKALTEKSDFRALLYSVESEVRELRCGLCTKTHELNALVSFYSNREKPVLRSPQALPQSPRVSSYTELRMVDLQEANAKLQQESRRLQSELEETTARSASTRDKIASQGKELEDEHARLKLDNQALEDRIGDLEVKLNNQLELQRKSEEDYYECVKERDAHKEALRQQIDELTVEAAEERFQAEMEEMQNQCEICKTSASDIGQLTVDKDSQLKLENEHSEIHTLVAEPDELCHKIQLLEKDNEGLKCKLKSANEDCAKKLRAAFASINSEMNQKSAEMMKSNLALREETAMWKEKCLNQQSLCERREALLKKHIAEMTEHIKQSSKDTQALKAQTEEQQAMHLSALKERDKLASELTAVMQERNRLAIESYCDAKLRQHAKKEAEKSPAGGANQSLYSTRSLESIWSQRPLSSRQSRTSVTSGDELKVPHFKPNPRRESGVSRSGQVAQAEALDSSIFSESCFSCGEEQDLFSETTLVDLSSQPEDAMYQYSELYGCNSMLPQHLKSVYPVETQQCPIPATPLKGDSKVTFPEVASTFAAAASSGSFQQAKAAEDVTKRKRDARSSSSDDGSSKPPLFWGTAATPSKTKPKKSTQAPSSVKQFLISKFKQ